ncbi:MAG: dTDP-4-dehydrorhamnose 3,5-epimerase [Limnobacter sp.]|uniref:dTDP-4-dehydrorhamnose 3,5-epimerase n=1 Tax=Limnobacter sp. TaxID=2003368 RepID=UPI00391D7244
MKAIPTMLSGIVLLEPTIFTDERGYFFESFNAQRFSELTGYTGCFVQDNESLSHKGVLRGMHYQVAPKAQGKLVRVTQGSIFDVVVDIRPDSTTFGKWEGFNLSAENHRQLWIPPGFAHGFLALEDNTRMQYKVTEYWSKEHERCLAWNDTGLQITWPIEGRPTVSAKDLSGFSFNSIGAE